MKKQIKLFNQLSKRYDLSDFYVIRLSESQVALQGYCTAKNLKLLSDNMTTMSFDANNFLQGACCFGSLHIIITLTPKN